MIENMMKPYQDQAQRIRWHRSVLGLTQEEYAARAKLKRATVNNWESGDYQVGLAGARALYKAYGLSLDFIYEGIDGALPMALRNALSETPISEHLP